jgi:hypothetical protein
MENKEDEWLLGHIRLFTNDAHMVKLGQQWELVVRLIYEHERAHGFKVNSFSDQDILLIIII